MSPSEQLAALGITLPPAIVPVGIYVPARLSGNFVYLAGHVAKRNGEVVTGKVGADISLEEAKQLARQTALDLLASAAAVAGGVDGIGGVVKLTGYVNCVPGFIEHPVVMNGASELMVEIFGDSGRHARSAVGVSDLPLDAVLEIEAIFELLAGTGAA